jgi:hypothetical protein
MDRFSHDNAGRLNYQAALEFIGEVRAGISWERFCIEAARHSDALISLLGDTAGSGEFLASKGISRQYVHDQVREILRRILFSKEIDHYLALGLPHNASGKEIQKRWKDLMLIYHPDRSSDAESSLCAARVNEAYNMLKNAELRAEYDRNLSRQGHFSQTAYAGSGYEAFRQQNPPAESAGTSRILPRIVIPAFLAAASLVLLMLFLENRQKAFHSDELLKTAPAKIQVPQAQRKESVGAEEQQVAQTNISPEDRIRTTESPGLDLPARPEKKQRAPEKTPQLNAPLAKLPDKKEEKEGLPAPAVSRPIVAEKPDEAAPIAQNPPVAKVAMAVPSAAPRAQAPAVSEETHTADWKHDVYLFLLQYVSAYEKGDINAFMGLRSREIIENNSLRYEDVRTFYKTTFEGGRHRYNLRDVKIERGSDGFIVNGIYRIEKLSGSDKGATAGGRISLTLRKEDGALRLVRADYDGR